MVDHVTLVVDVHYFTIFTNGFCDLGSKISKVLVDDQARVLLLIKNALIHLLLMWCHKLVCILLSFQLTFLLHEIFDYLLKRRLGMRVLVLAFGLAVVGVES